MPPRAQPKRRPRGLGVRLALGGLAALLACLRVRPAAQAQDPLAQPTVAPHRLFVPMAGAPAHRIYLLSAWPVPAVLPGARSSPLSPDGLPFLQPPDATASLPQRTPAGFVTRAGGTLQVDGRAYEFVGVNVSYLAGPFFPETHAEEIIALLAANGVQVIRVFVEPWCDLDRVERMLDRGGAHGVRFVLTLQDFFNHADGYWFKAQYEDRDLPHIRNIVPRFADRAEILAWELMNEPTCPAADANQACWDALCNWAKVTSEEIKRLDPNHLLSVGMQRGGFDAQAMDAFRRIHALDTVDLVSIHALGDKAARQEYGLELAIARALDKPVFFGEVALAGRPGASPDLRPGAAPDGDGAAGAPDALAERAQAIAAGIQDSRAAGVAGYLLWQYAYGSTDWTDRLGYFSDDPVWEVLRGH